MKQKYKDWFEYLPYIWTITLVSFLILLTVLSGIWPPFVAVKTGSMSPHINPGDYVYTVEPERYTPAGEQMIKTKYEALNDSNSYSKFNNQGDVIIYYPNGDKDRTPVIHRAIMKVEEGENWVERSREDHFIRKNATCEKVPNCPAPRTGYITRGDAVDAYDQARGLSEPVEKEWIKSKALIRVPYFTYIYTSLAFLLTFGAAIFGGIKGFSYITQQLKEDAGDEKEKDNENNTR